MLKSYKFWVSFSFLVLIFLIWFGGPFVGMDATELRLIGIITVLVIVISLILFEQWRAVRSANLLESSIMSQAAEQLDSTRPDRKEEIKALNEQLAQAIKTLKTSRLAKGLNKNAALYALPWYMLIGPPAAGKSTAIKTSGLDFPFGKDIQGVGGTRNCDWWFTNEAILLDTAGRYMTEDSDAEEWRAFLDFLKKHRKKAPINGVIVAIGIAGLITADDEKLEWDAKRIRSKVDELVDRLGIVFPVYLVFTKCDLIKGFVEIFEDMGKNERSQVWGTTFERSDMTSGSVVPVFAKEFDRFYENLCARRLSRIVTITNPQKVEAVFNFPVQYKYCKGRLSQFIGHLFQDNPYSETPFFRGVYFTSGTQEGAPVDQVISSIGRAAGVSEDMLASFGEEKESKSYFIKDLFREVIFKDQELVSTSGFAQKRIGTLKTVIFAVSVIIVVLGVGFLSMSFISKRSFLHRTFNAAQQVIAAGQEGKFEEDIERLESLRTYVARLDEYSQSTFSWEFGVSRIGKIEPVARKVYFAKFESVFLKPTAKKLEQIMGGFRGSMAAGSASQEDARMALKAYLMLSDPGVVDEDFLNGYLGGLWQSHLDEFVDGNPAGIREKVPLQINFYISQIADDDTPRVMADEVIVAAVRKKLTAEPEAGRIYASIKQKARIEPVSLRTIFYGRRNNILVGDYQINGFFSGLGYTGYLKKELEKVGEYSGGDEWVLGKKGATDKSADKARLIHDIQKLYFEEYVRQWRAFLSDIRIKPFTNISSALDYMKDLSGMDSPMLLVFEAVYENMEGILADAQPSGIKTAADSILNRIKRVIGSKTGVRIGKKSEKTEDDNTNWLIGELGGIIGMYKQGDDNQGRKGTPLGLYLDDLSLLSDKIGAIVNGADPGADSKMYAVSVLSGSGGVELKSAWKNTQRLLDVQNSSNRKAVSTVVEGPIKNIWSVILKEAQENLNKVYREEVLRPFNQSLKDRYPFNRKADDASLVDLAEFFRPESGTLPRFYKNEFKPFLVKGSRGWVTKKWLKKGISISGTSIRAMIKAESISDILFSSDGRPHLAFDIYPHPVSGVSEILLKVDGKEFRYRNEPQEWFEMRWPGDAEPAGARLQVTGEMRHTMAHGGEWGLFRLFDEASIAAVSANKYKATWRIYFQDELKMEVFYTIRADSYKNPFDSYDSFFNLALPGSIG